MSTHPPSDEANDLHQDAPEAPAASPDLGEQTDDDAAGAGPLPDVPAPEPEETAGESAPAASTSSAYTDTYGDDSPPAEPGSPLSPVTPAPGSADLSAEARDGGEAGEPGGAATEALDPGGDPVAGTAPPAGDKPAATVPTPEEDEALRAERARRFGRFGRTRTESDDLGDPAEGEVRTTALPTAAPVADTAPTTQPVTERDLDTEPQVNEENPFEDWDDPPRSRASAHWWGALIALVFTPVAWYLLADGGERWVHSQEINPDAIHFGALLEIAGGVLALIAVLLAARWSSVGPIILGSIGTLIGAAFLAVPQVVQDFLADYNDVFGRLGQFGQNVYNHLLTDGNAGRILVYGVVLIFAGVISHGARRQGRREERRRAAVEL